MSVDPHSDVVVDQYERWVYPEPITDLPLWLTSNWQWFDPSHDYHMLWPSGQYEPGMRILIAGCGTNQAAVFAYTNPGATVVAIDVSQPSLDHQAQLKQQYGLRNLELRLLPIEEVGTLGQDFDLIVSTGVLHHLADPQIGMNALAQQLRPNGVIALMLYARYGRVGVEIMEGVFQDLNLQQDQDSVSIVKEALNVLPNDHPIKGYLASAPDLAFDAGLVDTFLHGRERSYAVADCLDLVASADLVFQDWFFTTPYEPIPEPGDAFLNAVAALPDEQRWSIMERVNTNNACHFFTARHAGVPPSEYRLDWDSPSVMDAVPIFRYRCQLEGNDIVRHGYRFTLTPEQASIVKFIDGYRSLRDIVDAAIQNMDSNNGHDVITAEFAQLCIHTLVLRDFLTMKLQETVWKKTSLDTGTDI